MKINRRRWQEAMQRGKLIGIFSFVFAALTFSVMPQARAAVITQTADTNGPTYNGGGFGGSFQQFNPLVGTS